MSNRYISLSYSLGDGGRLSGLVWRRSRVLAGSNVYQNRVLGVSKLWKYFADHVRGPDFWPKIDFFLPNRNLKMTLFFEG